VGPPLSHVPYGAVGEDDPGPRRSVVLSGGGVRVSYQVGALKALFDHGLTFRHMDGTSGGGLNLAMLLSGQRPAEILSRWASLESWDFLALRPLGDYVEKRHVTAVGSPRGVTEKVLPHLGIDMERVRAASGVDATFNLCDFSRKSNEEIPHTRMDRDLLVAGMSLPGVLPPLHRDGTYYLDSGFIQDANLMSGVRRGCEEIWLIWALGNAPDYRGGVLELYVQMLEMSAQGGLAFHLERIREVNRRIAIDDSPYGQRRPVRLHLIRPDHPLPLDSDLYLGKVDHATLITMGYRDARRYLETMSDEGLPLEPEITQMTPRKPGITFKEKMAGGFALGQREPEAGREAGKRAGTKLAMHATVTVDDIQRFVADPQHQGGLAGTIDFPPLGQGIPAHDGVFNLFSPTEAPRLKLMIYEMAFERDGKQYYLAGKKEVRDDPGFDLWKDTTTLFTRLHEGTGKSGPVVGSGILTLGVADLIKLLSTVRATGTDSVKEKTEVISTFGRFFLGELWDSYVRHVPEPE